MIQDSTNQYITAILSQCDLRGKEVLEIGCGKGRITRDLAMHAKRIVATDPDAASLETARSVTAAGNIEFMQVPTGIPDIPDRNFDIAVYTLSLHHVPTAEMSDSLRSAAKLLRKDGIIIVVEPGDGGSFSEVKERFGAGSGDERSAKNAAILAMHSLKGWRVEETVLFRTLFQFENDEDFLVSMLPAYRQLPEFFVNEVRSFLDQHRNDQGIILEAERRLNVLRPI